MSTTDETLATIEAAVLEVPGVTDLYRSRPTVASAVQAVRSIATSTGPLRIVDDDDDALRVVIGTDGFRPAPEVARAVHDVALATAAAHGLALSRVDVRVARVG
ncbi:hypothetical protein JG550_002600 [Curtobacterium flaccumfaciens pv. flaccumfaciens]|uniref:hypothetical protein n=1 Tax=Curtobacterium flaccumfaciens TaxID=2035 RepID=UPI001ADA57AE|nr:hypothetical protein [Curtobacterium flaccumfaciens]MBO9047622.1 hypothetical protein [Curtobacterium flaccumfaciens pv. flaccumfaciens]QTR89921.1 hypothetical protein JG550_002600 [Curtobacterium flaccumfaciens pv. flaccumfaciens]